MIYTTNIGKIYDSIFFLVEYFNKDFVESEFTKIYDDTSMMVACYNEIKQNITDIPNLLSPMFYINNGMASPFSSFFSNKIDVQSDDMDSFITKIKSNPDLLYKKVVDCFFTGCSNSDTMLTPGEYINELESLPLTVEFKLQIALLFGNFNYAVDILSDTLKIIYDEVNKLHERHAKDIQFEFERIQTENNLQLYKNHIKYDLNLFETTSVSISLLNQYIILTNRKSNHLFMLLGLKHEESISDKYDDAHVTADSFIITCGSDIRMKIIRALIENKEMTSSQMAKYIGCPPTTLIRNIDAMQSSGIIFISKHEGLQIFYKLNIKLLNRIKVNIDELFQSMLKSVAANDN
jgi:Transcriptional regulators